MESPACYIWAMTMQFQKKDPRATISTPFGEIRIRFYPDDAPRHVENFINLAKMGFYDDTTFHRVVPGFIIQGGDPLSKTSDRMLHGTGGPGYFLNPEPNDRPHKRGAISMAKMPRDGNSKKIRVPQSAPRSAKSGFVFTLTTRRAMSRTSSTWQRWVFTTTPRFIAWCRGSSFKAATR